jgi:hypothetical protein
MSKKYFLILFILLIPQVTFAAWYNPLSWSWIKSMFSREILQEKSVDIDRLEQTDLNNLASSTPQAVEEKIASPSQPIEIDKADICQTLWSSFNTPEQTAIQMATDPNCVGANSHVSVRQEINNNWDAIMKHNTGKRGRGTIDAIYQDIMDAYIDWKFSQITPPVTQIVPKSGLSDLAFCLGEANKIKKGNPSVDLIVLTSICSNTYGDSNALPTSSGNDIELRNLERQQDELKRQQEQMEQQQNSFNRSICTQNGGIYSTGKCYGL